jgi:hypothetical protein
MSQPQINPSQITQVWWRDRWPWLLMLGPAVAMVGCIITIVLALQHFSDQPIYDGGVKRGLVVEKKDIKANANHVANPASVSK